MSWKPELTKSDPNYKKHNLELALDEINDALDFLEETQLSGRWLVVRCLRYARWWVERKIRKLKDELLRTETETE